MFDFFANNPDRLDTPAEIRDRVRAAGGDPMDIGTQEQAQFAWSLLHSWEDDPPPSRTDPAVMAAETEFVADALVHDYGVELDEWPAIRDAPPWYDRGRRR